MHLPTNNETQTFAPFASSKSQTTKPAQGNPVQKLSNSKAQGGFHKKPQLPSIARIVEQVQQLQQLACTLAPTSPFEETNATIHEREDSQQREDLFQRTKEVMTYLEQAVQQNHISPSGKHGRSVSAVLGNIMSLYSASCVPSAFDECVRVLAALDHWNLDRLEAHYQYAILAAVHEQRWQEASDLFLQQLDRDISGFSPIQVSVSSPVGLYAIARASQDKGVAAVEPVLDAVTSLSLISPRAEEQHVLAAGTALGLAGDWEGLVSYLENSINATNMGQSLVAATMHACILCNQNDAALQVFRTLLDGHLAISSEFHWGGEQHQISPLCRDLAMRASVDTLEEGYSEQALELLSQALQEELTVSGEALEGVLGACERDQRWEEAVDVFFRCITSDNNLLIVSGASLRIPTMGDYLAEQQRQQLQVNEALVNRGKILASVMRTCNAANHSGTALICNILADTAAPGSILSSRDFTTSVDHEASGPIEQTLLPLLTAVDNPGELLSAVMVALCGVSCFEHACSLYDKLTKDHAGEGADYSDAWTIRQYAQSQAAQTAESFNLEWESAHRHIYRLCAALRAIHIKGVILDRDDLQTLSSAYASALRSCAVAKEAEAGKLLGQHIQSELSRLAASSEDSHSFFGRPTQNYSEYGLILDDNLLAAKMEALQRTKQNDVALALFESAMEVEGETIVEWSQTCNQAMKLLMRNEEEEKAVMLLRKLVKSTDNIESFATAGQIFAQAERWSDVADIYHMALEKGCVSRDLGILAMKAAIEVKIAGRLRVLRGIIHDCARAEGQSAVDWLDANYWRIKSALGFSHARMLMWWNDPNTSHLDELQYALDVFEKRLADGLQAKNVTLKLIVTHARHFQEGDIPADKKEIVRVPRERQGWVKLLERVLQESGNLQNDVYFIAECAMALRNLGCNVECVNFVKAAMKRGVTVRRNALSEALMAAEAAGILDEAADIKLALYA